MDKQNSIPSRKQLFQYYRTQSEDISRMYLHPTRHYKQRRRLDIIQESISNIDLSSCHILDIGCGDGHAFDYIFQDKPYKTYTGVDLSLKKMNTMNKRLKKATGILADAENLPLQTQAFDCVICFETFEHLINPSRALSEIYRVLKPGGILIFSIPVDSVLQSIWKSVRSRLSSIKKNEFNEHIRLFTLSGIREVLRKHKFLSMKEERMCSFSFPFDNLIRGASYDSYVKLDNILCHIPLQHFGIGSEVSIAIGREYYIATVEKNQIEVLGD